MKTKIVFEIETHDTSRMNCHPQCRFSGHEGRCVLFKDIRDSDGSEDYETIYRRLDRCVEAELNS